MIKPVTVIIFLLLNTGLTVFSQEVSETPIAPPIPTVSPSPEDLFVSPEYVPETPKVKPQKVINPEKTKKQEKKQTLPPEPKGKYLEQKYKVQRDDSFVKIAAKYGLNYQQLMKINQRKTTSLTVGEEILLYSGIIPEVEEDFSGIIVNIPEKKLFHFEKGSFLKTYPVSVGLPDWQTPDGNFRVITKSEAPTWHVPISIQKEMEEKGQEVKKMVPPGPDNPLGNWWMGLSAQNIGIHSTNVPWSIGYSVTHGCVRMRPIDAKELFAKIPVKTMVRIIYQPVKAGIDEKKQIYLQVYPDIYQKKINYYKMAGELIGNFAGINRQFLEKALREKKGIVLKISN